jgi:hypothetical protein
MMTNTTKKHRPTLPTRRVTIVLDLPVNAPTPTSPSHLAALLGAWPTTALISVSEEVGR